MRRKLKHDSAGQRKTGRPALFEKRTEYNAGSDYPSGNRLFAHPFLQTALPGKPWGLRGGVMKGGGSDVGHTNEGLSRRRN